MADREKKINSNYIRFMPTQGGGCQLLVLDLRLVGVFYSIAVAELLVRTTPCTIACKSLRHYRVLSVYNTDHAGKTRPYPRKSVPTGKCKKNLTAANIDMHISGTLKERSKVKSHSTQIFAAYSFLKGD